MRISRTALEVRWGRRRAAIEREWAVYEARNEVASLAYALEMELAERAERLSAVKKKDWAKP